MKTITKKIKVDKKWAKQIQKHMDENKPLDENINERKDQNNLTYMESALTKNKLVAKPTAIDEATADGLGVKNKIIC